LTALRTFALAALVSLVLCSAASADTPTDAADRMLERVNAIRANHGLPALRAAPRLGRTAARYGRRLMRTNTFGHGDAARAAGFRSTGEILAYASGWALSPRGPLRLWLRSSTHSALILGRGFRYVGVNPARGRFGGRLATIWVMHFGGRG
jgi:uncharacterized protein YkwD